MPLLWKNLSKKWCFLRFKVKFLIKARYTCTTNTYVKYFWCKNNFIFACMKETHHISTGQIRIHILSLKFWFLMLSTIWIIFHKEQKILKWEERKKGVRCLPFCPMKKIFKKPMNRWTASVEGWKNKGNISWIPILEDSISFFQVPLTLAQAKCNLCIWAERIWSVACANQLWH